MHAIVLAGGRGTRLRPHTGNRPKALVTVGDHALLEIILRQLRASGFTRVTLCVSYLRHMIEKRFGDGASLGLAIDYSVDAMPLGTAGPLGNVDDWYEPALVMNADLLTTVDFGELHRFHVRCDAVLTIAVQQRRFGVDLGVLDVIEGHVRGMREKPRLTLDVCTGIYVVSPELRAHLHGRGPVDMSQLILEMIEADRPVMAYPFAGQWRDIGTPAGLEQARMAFAANESAYLPAAACHAPFAAVAAPCGDDDLALLVADDLGAPGAPVPAR